MRYLALALVALLCATTLHAASLDDLHRRVATAGKDIFPINFHALILISEKVPKQVGSVHCNQVDLESPAHQVDAISAFVHEYSEMGGVAQNLDALVTDPSSSQMVKQRTLSFISRPMSDVCVVH